MIRSQLSEACAKHCNFAKERREVKCMLGRSVSRYRQKNLHYAFESWKHLLQSAVHNMHNEGIGFSQHKHWRLHQSLASWRHTAQQSGAAAVSVQEASVSHKNQMHDKAFQHWKLVMLFRVQFEQELCTARQHWLMQQQSSANGVRTPC